jgi:hypothetical protein
MAAQGNAVAFVFADELVAGGSPRVNGTSNKVLWVAKGYPSNFMVQGTPLGMSEPLVSVAGGPSEVEVPTPGCWTFRLSWGTFGQFDGTTINLEALPAGSVPGQPAT